MPKPAWVKSFDTLVDFLSLVVVCAPDRFPREDFLRDDEQLTLDEAFAQLERGMPFVAQELPDDAVLARLRGVLRASRDAYAAGDRRKGAHLLQDVQDVLQARRGR